MYMVLLISLSHKLSTTNIIHAIKNLNKYLSQLRLVLGSANMVLTFFHLTIIYVKYCTKCSTIYTLFKGKYVIYYTSFDESILAN